MAFSYTAKREDLYRPYARGNYFPRGVPNSEPGLCAEIARLAYCRGNVGSGFDVGQMTAVLSRVGFNVFRFFEGQHKPMGANIHGFLASRSDVANHSKLTILAFRGTDADDPTDLCADASVGLTEWKTAGKVHSGFAEALEDVRVDIQNALASVEGRLLFTGHSLGAAIATLLATVHQPSVLYTFGSPRVGDHDFATSLDDVRIRRYVNCCDLIPRMPPDELGYVQGGPLFYIDREQRVIAGPEDSYMEEDHLLARESYLRHYAWKVGNVAVRDLADHAPLNYAAALMSS